MKSFTRTNQIVKIITQAGQATVVDLSIELGVSVETVRRDLKALDEKGDLVRVHGGAVSKEYQDVGTSFVNRAGNNVEDKRKLVDQAISNVFEGAVIGLDASSSSWHFAQDMPDMRCTIVTNSINNISALSGKKNISVISLGGCYSEKYKAFYGMITNNTLAGMALDFCVISCAGFDVDSGVWDSNEYNYDVKRILIEVSEKTILIADKSKYKKRSLLRVCEIDDIDMILSNAILSGEDEVRIKGKMNILP